MRRRTFTTLPAALILIVLVAAGCAEGNDPDTWEAAEAQEGAIDYPVKDNFVEACKTANADEQGMSAEEAAGYCECAFRGIRAPENVSEGGVDGLEMPFEEFKTLDDDLRSDNEDLPADVRTFFEGLAGQAGSLDPGSCFV